MTRLSLKKNEVCAISLCLALVLPCATFAQEQPAAPFLAEGFRNVPQKARMRMYWRVFGPAWSKSEIDYQLALLKEAGVGGVMTAFTYPLATDNPTQGIVNQKFLSAKFLETLNYAAKKANGLGLRFGVVGGTGWPYGGPSVSLADSAQHLREVPLPPRSDGMGYTLPPLREGETYVAAFVAGQELLAQLQSPKSTVTPQGDCRLFIAGPTRMQVKRAALGGEGYVLDHLSQDATTRYLENVVSPLMEALTAIPNPALFCDSLEVYRTNWTHDFPKQFLKRRGYDLIPHLLELFDDASPNAKNVRYDFWRVVAELAEQNFAQTLYQWAKRRHVTLEAQLFGTPSMGLTAAQYADIPTGEQYEWKGFSFSRFASSGAHLAGKSRIGAEAWTWLGIPNRLGDSLADLKLASDLHFLAGANDLAGVDFPYSPRGAGVPGWMPYFGPVFNQNNPQWVFFPYLSAYINRCQWLLQQGKPVADVAVYLPTEDSFAETPPQQLLLNFAVRDRLAPKQPTGEFGLAKSLRHQSELLSKVLALGYNYDGLDSFALRKSVQVRGNALVSGHGHYRVLILPNLKGLDWKALEKIRAFCMGGGTVIATQRLPDRVYGSLASEKSGELNAVIREMFGDIFLSGNAPIVQTYGAGKAIFVPNVAESLGFALAQSQVTPDVRILGTTAPVSHVHRRIGDQDFYFLANVGEEEAEFRADFRVGEKQPSLWQPLTGEITPLPALQTNAGRVAVALNLPPRGSAFVCFAPGKPIVQLNPPRQYPFAMGTALAAQALDGVWQVTLPEGQKSSTRLIGYPLSSWADWEGAQQYSGVAVYKTTAQYAGGWPGSIFLQCEQVHEVAEVFVNGKKAGAMWLPPYRIDVKPFLKSGKNTFEFRVANLPLNRVLGLPEEELTALRAAYGDRFPAPSEKRSGIPPAPSGIVGNVLLLFSSSTQGNN